MFARGLSADDRRIHMKKIIVNKCTFLVFFLCLGIFVFLKVNAWTGWIKLDNSTELEYFAVFIGLLSLGYSIFINKVDSKEKENDLERHYREEYGKHKKVIGFIEKNLDNNGNLKREEQLIELGRPDAGELIEFIRFIKGLYCDIKDGKVSKAFAKKWCSKYPLAIYNIPFFRKGFENYNSPEWEIFRDYCKEINS